jgi:hypothetical protein
MVYVIKYFCRWFIKVNTSLFYLITYVGYPSGAPEFLSVVFCRSLIVIFSSPGPKVHVNYCHHLASVVCKLFTFQASSPKPLGRLEPNLAGMFLGWSSTKLLFFVPVGYSIWLPGPIICSDWLKF